MTTKTKGHDGGNRGATPKTDDRRKHTATAPLIGGFNPAKPPAKATEQARRGAAMNAPSVTGQCAEVLSLIRQHQPVLSFILTADHAIPEAAARVHDLRGKGFNVITRIAAAVDFRGRIRHNAAFYSLGSPEWPYPGFLTGTKRGGDVE